MHLYLYWSYYYIELRPSYHRSKYTYIMYSLKQFLSLNIKCFLLILIENGPDDFRMYQLDVTSSGKVTLTNITS
jgi:hypothetical protein